MSGRLPLYRPLDWLLVRTPLLPVAAYDALAGRADWPTDAVPDTLLPANPRLRRALAVGGGDLTRALEHPPTTARARQRLAGKLLRYAIRMSTRPTPYGLFAGIALADWGEHTDVSVAAERPRVRTRPDMAWLLDLVNALEQRPDVRAHVRWFANPMVVVHSGRVFLDEPAAGRPVSLRATGAVRRALAAAGSPIADQELTAELRRTPGATPAKVARLIEQLWQHNVLLTDLRPPLTAPDPARQVAERLAEIPAARAEARALAELLDAMADWDRMAADEGSDQYPKLVAQANSVHPVAAGTSPMQVDAALPLGGRTVHRAVAMEAARAAELLLRLSLVPRGASGLDGYRHQFEARYGTEAEVPILELLDPRTGLGPPRSAHGGGAVGDPQMRQRTLLDLALGALRDRRQVLDLDENTLRRLETWPPTSDTAPTSLDISAFVVAESAAALDAGAFQLVVGPNLGAAGAGRVLGRFADLVDGAPDALRSAMAQDAAARPGTRSVEITYLPRRDRSANVAIRPSLRDWQVVLGTTPGPRAEDCIPLRELTVGVRDGQLVLRRLASDVELVPGAGHMLNTMQAPGVVRFLDDLARQHAPQLSQFDWGPAAGFPFLPRIQVGRVVLALARWQVDDTALPPKPAEEFPNRLTEWRQRWQAPRHVYLAAGDNRLLLDLDDAAQAEQLRVELGRRRLVLQEALPGPEHAWLPGSDGGYLSEFVVPVVLAKPRPAPQAPAARPVRSPVALTGARLRPPGGDWLYAKLYHQPDTEEELLTGPVATFCADALADGLADNWFFLRYSDPEPHLRIRLHGEPGLLTDELAPRLLRWAGGLVEDGRCQRVCLDTYDKEVERYGGQAAMAIAEQLFGVDSQATLELLRETEPADRTLLAVRTVDELLAGLGLTEAERVAWCREMVADRKGSSAAYRSGQAELRALLGNADEPGGAVTEILDRQRVALRPLTARLDELAARGELWQPKHRLARSFVHMHCNRLLGIDRPAEQRTLGLLLRTRESLLRAPLAPSRA